MALTLSVVSGAPDARTADLLVYAAFTASTPDPLRARRDKKKQRAKKKAVDKKPAEVRPDFGGHLHDVDAALGGLLIDTAVKEGFTGGAGQTFSFHTHGRVAASRVLLVGMGPADKGSVDSCRNLAAQAVSAS